jgi:hypothetical protein
MPSNNAGKASPGSPFVPPPAVIWNNMVDAGRAWADSQLSNGAPPPSRPRPTDLIRIKNDCGADRDRGEILLISGKAITDLAEESIWLLGDTPTADGYFAILKEPIQSGDVGTAQVSGCCLATIDVIDIDHTRAKPSAGDYVLESSTDGPIEILYSPGTTGEQECVVRFGSSGGGGGSLFRFELTADFTTGTTVAATIKSMAGSTVGTGISLADPEAIFLGLQTGSKGYCIEQGGTYYIVQAACNDEEAYL